MLRIAQLQMQVQVQVQVPCSLGALAWALQWAVKCLSISCLQSRLQRDGRF